MKKTEWECIDLRCTHFDGDMCRRGICDPDSLIIQEIKCPKCGEGWTIRQTDLIPGEEVLYVYWQCNKCLQRWESEEDK